VTNHEVNADDYAGSLAHVVKVEGGSQDIVLGQAWLVGFGRLITCGHVVDAYVQSPHLLYIHFPQSGNRYQVNQIRLHPSFVRQPDQLVKFDAAVLAVELNPPETAARLLPIVYEKTLPVQLALTAVRFPTHLGQFSSAVNPLAQMGRLLGPLRKHDNFHLLHDLALSPGDSGTAIFGPDGSVVALHCGDTATLPGLNLPTTSIRLALWVDALRDLGVEGSTQPPPPVKAGAMGILLTKFAVGFALAFALVAAILIAPSLSSLQIDAPKVKPILVHFNHPRNGYRLNEPVEITLKANSDCSLYLFLEESDSPAIYRLFPQDDTGALAALKAGESVAIKTLGTMPIKVNDQQSKFHLFAVTAGLPPQKVEAAFEVDPVTNKTDLKDNRYLMTQLVDLKKRLPSEVIYGQMEGPIADLRLPPFEKK